MPQMHFFLSAIIIALSSRIKSGVAETCTFCAGITLDNSFEIPESDGATCGQVVTAAKTFEEGTDDCTGLQLLEIYCCPSGNDLASCTFCEGVDELGYTVISQGVTCRDAAATIVPMIAGDSAECMNFKILESICCPSSVTPPESPCSFCAGLDVLQNVSVEGVSCATAVKLAAALESTSQECSSSLPYQAICCPVEPTVACSFCNDAITVNSGTVVRDKLTCAEVADYAAWLESTADECNTIQQDEAMCCPDATASPNSSPDSSPAGMPTSSNVDASPETTPIITPSNVPAGALPAVITLTSGQSIPSSKPTSTSSGITVMDFPFCLLVSLAEVTLVAYFAIA